MALIFESVTKRYRSGIKAVNDVSLRFGPGIVGLLGPNGAGKTTLMQMVATRTRPTSGRILFQGRDIGRDPDFVRSRLGYLPQDFGVYDSVTAFEFISFLGGLKGVRKKGRVMEVLEAVNLHTVAHRQVRTFSGGMKQRLGIAQALVNDPELLIVDEPTAGLDPEERVRFRTLLTSLGRSALVILSTHIVSDVEAIAGTIALLQKGRILKSGSPEELLAAAAGQVWEAVLPSHEFERQRSSLRISSAAQRPDGVHVRLVGDGAGIIGATCAEPNLEDAYILLTGGAQPS
ncbi:ABC transporter ATP-binding protein [bacterium]|nr:MAG: ABC transporter ATP-binding protein [bacterium]